MSPYWKSRLIEYFCLGLPAYRIRLQVPLDLKTVQRWFRIVRLAIYDHEKKEMDAFMGRTGARTPLGGNPVRLERDFKISAGQLVLGICKGNGRIFTLPVTVPSPGRNGNPQAETGNLHYCGETLAYTFLDIHGGSVVVQGGNGTQGGRKTPEGIEEFWTFARQWLKNYRGIPKDYFPLYLKEIEWRFNHRGENIARIVRKLLDQRAVAESER
jgi:transposase